MGTARDATVTSDMFDCVGVTSGWEVYRVVDDDAAREGLGRSTWRRLDVSTGCKWGKPTRCSGTRGTTGCGASVTQDVIVCTGGIGCSLVVDGVYGTAT